MFPGSDGVEESFGTLCFSQEGEDGVLARIFDTRTSGFYVDVGAHHPFRYSNTNAFYRKGWRGINVEANPEALALFQKYRPDDINLHYLVAETDDEERSYTLFAEGALNTADPNSLNNLRSFGLDVRETIVLKSRRLDSILDDYLKPGTEITFLSVDVEGLDLSVLRSNNWSKYRPLIVLGEESVDLSNPTTSLMVNFMTQQGYKLRSYLHQTAVFERTY